MRSILVLISMWMALAGGGSGIAGAGAVDLVRSGVTNALMVRAAQPAPRAYGQKTLPGDFLYAPSKATLAMPSGSGHRLL